MNNLTLPPAANWFQAKAAVCAADNTFIYAAHDAIVIIKPTPFDRPANISFIPYAHTEKILALALAPTWTPTTALVASIADDKVVKVWNLRDNTCIHSHSEHASCRFRPISLDFAGNNKIVSVSENGFIVEWKMTTNEFTTHRGLLGNRVVVTAMSICPHDAHLIAFGLKTGLVLLIDFLDKPRVLYKLKAHHQDISDISWCPSSLGESSDEKIAKGEDTTDALPANGSHLPCQIEECHSEAELPVVDDVSQPLEANCDGEVIAEDLVPTPEVDTSPETAESIILKTQKEMTQSNKVKKNPWIDLKHADDDEMIAEDEPQCEEVENTPIDFLTECLALKTRIDELNLDDDVPAEECKEIQKDIPANDSQTESKIKKLQRFSGANLLLATASRGGFICIWNVGSKGRLQKRLRIPRPKSNNRNYRQTNTFWMCLNWIATNRLLSSGNYGEVYSWSVCESSPKPSLMSVDHYGQLFCISSSAKVLAEPYCPISKLHALSVWTIGKDRNILFTDLKNRSVLACYPVFGSPIQVFAASPIAPCRIAVGMVDGFIRFWDLTKPQNQYIDIIDTKNKVGKKVLSLAWHPDNEFLLAFGTDEGQVGVLHAGQLSKAPTFYAQNFHTPIYKVEWGPLAEKTALYICAEGSLNVYESEEILTAKTIETKSEYVTNFAWKPDHSKIAVGCKSGAVYILSETFQMLATIYWQMKAVAFMSWHPGATAEDEEQSPNHEWLAFSISSGNRVIIYDTSKHDSVKDLVVAELKDHLKHVNCFQWSPYKTGHMVTVSEDGTALIWDNGELKGTFVNLNTEPLLAVLWSPLNENFIITGGRECAVNVWDLREQIIRDQEEIKAERVRRMKQISHSIMTHKQGTRGLKGENIVVPGIKTLFIGQIAYRQSDFRTSLEDCRAIFERETGKAMHGDNAVVGLFGSHEEILRITEEQKELQAKGKVAISKHISMWTGDMGEAIKNAISEDKVTPFHIMVAPMISHNLWEKALESYATQLSESKANNDTIEIASFYLALHQIDKAINILFTREFYREALALTKLKTPDDTNLINEILLKWAENSMLNGRYELAAQCYLSLGEVEQAAKAIMKRSNAESCAFALELAKHVDNISLINTIQYKLDEVESAKISDDLDLQPVKELALQQNGSVFRQVPQHANDNNVENDNGVSSDNESVDCEEGSSIPPMESNANE